MGDDRVACVVVTYLRPDPLRQALRAIRAQARPPDAVYVIDNGRGNETASMLRSEFSEVAYLNLQENLGVGAGLARGIEAALDDGADYVWFLDDDSIPEPRALDRCLTLLKGDRRVGLVGYAGGGLRWGVPAPFRGQRQRVGDVGVYRADFLELDGALITAEAVRAVGLPRSDFFMMMEGIEYSGRVGRVGFKVACLAEDLIDRTHLGAGNASSPPWRAYYQTRNHLVMALEHRSARELVGWGYRQLKFLAGTLLRLDRKRERIVMRTLGAWHGVRGLRGRTVEPVDGAGGNAATPHPTSAEAEGSAVTSNARPTRRGPPSMVSVIIPAHNAGPLLGQQLEAMVGQWPEGRWEVIIADNLSTDDSVERARSYTDRLSSLRIVEARARPSAGHARNVGATAAEGDFLVFCDADDIASPGWLAAMVEAAQRGDVVGGRLDSESLNDTVQRAWQPMPVDGLPALGSGFFFVSTANCGVWASVFRDLGGFPEDYVGAGGEDMDFAIGVQAAGYTLSSAPEAVIHYRLRNGLRALARQSYAYGRANAKVYRKYRGVGLRRRSLRGTLWTWAWLLFHVPDLCHSPARRGLWVRRAANLCGRIDGSARYRVLFP